jgi:hypothetical protein
MHNHIIRSAELFEEFLTELRQAHSLSIQEGQPFAEVALYEAVFEASVYNNKLKSIRFASLKSIKNEVKNG